MTTRSGHHPWPRGIPTHPREHQSSRAPTWATPQLRGARRLRTTTVRDNERSVLATRTVEVGIVRAARILAPVADLWDWQLKGACRQANPELFFHPEGERGLNRRSRLSQAIAVCESCPVLQCCRDHALQTREPYGVWGGMTEDQRWDYHSALDN